MREALAHLHALRTDLYRQDRVAYRAASQAHPDGPLAEGVFFARSVLTHHITEDAAEARPMDLGSVSADQAQPELVWLYEDETRSDFRHLLGNPRAGTNKDQHGLRAYERHVAGLLVRDTLLAVEGFLSDFADQLRTAVPTQRRDSTHHSHAGSGRSISTAQRPL